VSAPSPGDGGAARRRAAELRRRGALAGLEPPWQPGAAVRIGEHVSGRRFYRLFPHPPAPPAPRSLVLVVYQPADVEVLERHVRTTRWLEAAGVRVPTLHDVGDRALLVEDGGDRLLADEMRHASRVRAYAAAIRVVRRIQRHGRETPPPNPGAALDTKRLLAELEYFERHTVGGWLDVSGGETRRRDGYADLAEAVGGLPVTLCHRDFHARNLLVDEEGRVMVLDFQDLMEGPFLYDLASLLWDNYCDVPAEIQSVALDRYWSGSEIDSREVEAAAGSVRRAFHLVAAQRHLKALGTFGYQVFRSGRSGWARFAPRTWAHARRALEALGMDELLAGLEDLERLACL